ncbi:MAG TPA: M14 family zinc carboxypeptidase [Bacteroidales bacterium]|nr:M14 family zinc carboxypeptidase [Bacteroidales bacterium]
MKHLFVISAALMFLTYYTVYGQDQWRGGDIREALNRFGQAEVLIEYPGYDAMSRLATRFSVSSCDDREAVLTLSPLTASDFISTGISYKIILPEETKGFFTASSVSEAMQWHSYPTWKHYDTIMHKIAQTWPELCLLDTIGFSVRGRAILALKISDNPAADEQEPAVMLSAAIHGDELAGFIMLMRLAEYLASESSNGGLAATLTSGLEIWINPLANPDGMYRDNDTIIYPVRSNSNGYDLNRNFPDPGVVSQPPLQTETTDMMSFMEKNRFALSVNLHSGAEVVNYPWDRWTRLHADDSWFYDISRRYADTVHIYSDPGYMTLIDDGVTRGSMWYIITGGRQDYITYSLGGREVTIEMDDTKQTPGPDLETLWNWNSRSLLRYIGEALYGVGGTVTDASSGDPLSAKVFITGHDTDSSHIYSDTLTGEFRRYLAPGTYSLTFTCPGYEAFSAEYEIASWNSFVSANVRLEPEEPVIYPDPPVSGLLIYPIPSSGKFMVLPPASVEGDIIVTLTSVSGSVVDTYQTTVQSGIPVPCDYSNMPQGVYIISVRKLPDGPLLRGKVIIYRLISG